MDCKLSFLLSLAGFFATPLFAQRPPSTQQEPVPLTFSMRGTVLNAESNQRLAAVKVQLSVPFNTGALTSFTNVSGEFTFVDLRGGVYQLAVDQEGYEHFEEAVEIYGHSRTDVIVFLRPRGTPPRTTSSEDSVVSAHELSLSAKAQSLRREGNARLYDKKDPKGSVGLFERAIRESPSYFEAYFDLGVAYLRLEKRPEAEGAFQKSVELSQKNFAPPLVALAAMLSDRRNFAGAEPLARRAVDLGALPGNANYQLGRALYGVGNDAEAEKFIRQAIALEPQNADAVLILANVHRRQKDYRALLADCETYLRLWPNGPEAGKVKETHEAVKRLLARAPASPLEQPGKP